MVGTSGALQSGAGRPKVAQWELSRLGRGNVGQMEPIHRQRAFGSKEQKTHCNLGGMMKKTCKLMYVTEDSQYWVLIDQGSAAPWGSLAKLPCGSASSG